MKYILLVIVLFSCNTTQDFINPPIPFTFVPVYARVKLKSNLVLKDSPSINATSLESISIPDHYIVLAKSRTEYREANFGVEDYWYEVLYRDKSGWVFGKFLDFSEEEVSRARNLPIVENTTEFTNFKKIKKYYDDNLKPIKIDQAVSIYGRPIKELKYTLSNYHGGFNRYVDLEYQDMRLKFIDKTLFEFFLSDNQRLNTNSRNIIIGSDWNDIEFEFGLPFSISKEKISYPTCHILIQNHCAGSYANTVEFNMENNKIKSIVFIRYVD